MKVLHLPHNINSRISESVALQRKIGIDAKGVAINNYLGDVAEHVKVFNPRDYGFLNPKKYFEYFSAHRELQKLIQWADIIHWYYNWKVLRTERVINFVKYFNKPAVVEFLGSEIRIPEILFNQNPYYKKIFSLEYSYQFESLEHSRSVQKKFKDAGFEALVRPELEQFIQKDIFPFYHKINNRIEVKKYSPTYPSTEKKKSLVVHPVSSRNAKGTNYVLEAIEKLKQKYDFEFSLIEHLQHQQALALMSKADIVIDQLILGAFGTISLEGMCFGKPTICFLTDEFQKNMHEIPLVNANPNTIYSALETLLLNPTMRNEIGIRSREYVEAFHDAEKINFHLKNIYEEIIRKKRDK